MLGTLFDCSQPCSPVQISDRFFACMFLWCVAASSKHVQCAEEVPLCDHVRASHGADKTVALHAGAAQGGGRHVRSVPGEDPAKGESKYPRSKFRRSLLTPIRRIAFTHAGHRWLCIPRLRPLGEEGRGPESCRTVREYASHRAARDLSGQSQSMITGRRRRCSGQSYRQTIVDSFSDEMCASCRVGVCV